MFGTKLRSWMEAHIVRPRRKQSRAAKDAAATAINRQQKKQNDETIQTQCADQTGYSTLSASNTGESLHRDASGSTIARVGSQGGALGASLSSPESAYSTGYSTDGTSPGAAAPPEYYINIRTGTHYFQRARDSDVQSAVQRTDQLKNTTLKTPDAVVQSRHRRAESCCPPSFDNVQGSKLLVYRSPLPSVKNLDGNTPAVVIQAPPSVLGAATSPSPRQRSRIRTNPWITCNSSKTSFNGSETTSCLSASSSSCLALSNSAGESAKETNGPISSANINPSGKVFTPISSRRQSPRVSRQHIISPKRYTRVSGKYDESYVYEKETDILSDSDPTDCEQDLMGCGVGYNSDTGGEEAGDEDTAFDEMDYIDAECGYTTLDDANDFKFKNTGRCTYHGYHEVIPPILATDAAARRRECYLRRSARRQQLSIQSTADYSDGGRKSKSIRRIEQGTRSLGGTPLSLRRHAHSAAAADKKQYHSTKSPKLEVRTKKRSNSVSFAEGMRRDFVRNNLTNCDSEIAIMEADKEADQKYKELILEAENILVSMKSATPSPRHRPMPNIPANKRVEHLRSTEIDLVFLKNRVEDASVTNSPKAKASPRFSPKKNHISNFIISNSPELSRKDSSDFTVKQITNQHALKSMPSNFAPVCPKSPAVMRKIYTNRLGFSDRNSQVKVNGRIMNEDSETAKNENAHKERFNIQSQMKNLRVEDDSDSCENDKSNYVKSDAARLMGANNQIIVKPGLGRANGVRLNLESSSSESDGRHQKDEFKKHKKPPLISFSSVDMGHKIQDTAYCPQSEPVKRKVYNCSMTYDRIQKTLKEPEGINARLLGDENILNDDTGKCHNNLRVKVAQLRRERLTAEANAMGSAEPSSCLQQQISQMRRQILLHTLEGLKRSLQDQSASLHTNYCKASNSKAKEINNE
ncbi:uncharacterized protein LOC113367191 [Ctenocephalides felis]|uniref:uncharacterized protein LOC113367191 n=1 Tax=Ctenocephalides felis TaxID=7515 RepID=UPI000E6E4094|nr:uncharacterized protein LOC113367191 [Ctenocephalides felis]